MVKKFSTLSCDVPSLYMCNYMQKKGKQASKLQELVKYWFTYILLKLSYVCVSITSDEDHWHPDFMLWCVRRQLKSPVWTQKCPSQVGQAKRAAVVAVTATLSLHWRHFLLPSAVHLSSAITAPLKMWFRHEEQSRAVCSQVAGSTLKALRHILRVSLKQFH